MKFISKTQTVLNTVTTLALLTLTLNAWKAIQIDRTMFEIQKAQSTRIDTHDKRYYRLVNIERKTQQLQDKQKLTDAVVLSLASQIQELREN